MKIAVLGTGAMGAPIARHLAEDGHVVRAWNRTADKARGIPGVEPVGTAHEAVMGAEVVVTMLADGPVTEQVMADALESADEGMVWWQAATVGLSDTEHLSLLAEGHGATLVDAPVLGTRQPAEAGELVVLASGPDPVLDRLEQPVFGPCAKRVVRLGATGTGTRTKLVCNHWITSLVAAVAETVKLAQALDVDPRTWLEVISGGPLDVGYAKVKGTAMVAGDFTPSFALDLAAKDVGLVLEAAERHDLALALAPVVLEQLQAASAAGHGADDLAAVFTASSR